MSALRTTLFAAGFMALGALGATAGSALARPGGHHGGPGAAGLGRVLASIDLTEAQEAALSDLRDEIHDDMRGAKDGAKDELAAIVAGIKTNEVDRAAIHQLIDDAAAERTAMAHKVTDRVLDVYDTLTPEQRAQLVDRIEDAEARRDEMRQRHHEHADRSRGD